MEKEAFKLGELILLEKLPVEKIPAPHYKDGWRYIYKGRYRCFCGKEFVTKLLYVACGDTKSCGCYNAYKVKNNINYLDGRSRTRLNNIYKKMFHRTTNKNNKDWHHYGGRGIRVCEEWRDFAVFKKWSEENGYNDTLTIDRINTNGNYEPSNCRWTTQRIQSINRRKSTKNSTSKYKGVHFDKNIKGTRPWVAKIKIGTGSKTLGRYSSEEEAALVYNQKAVEIFGPNAYLNVIL